MAKYSWKIFVNGKYSMQVNRSKYLHCSSSHQIVHQYAELIAVGSAPMSQGSLINFVLAHFISVRKAYECYMHVTFCVYELYPFVLCLRTFSIRPLSCTNFCHTYLLANLFIRTFHLRTCLYVLLLT